ncbi:hypothetical protein GCM10007415_35320 [Parapedobacter pyrenivorans]|uniref:Response regulatory domain-containing protein n=1 Tax=Parapedobacter pyrenivorans TaxID=1305674 RepID=A0A917HZ95_9SPHI|nr:response regulator [Parapedobacter pyrenivorans]GGG96959.1 hypothetical protein GCM10007415_35320 [Parapedobacter pyrenivorans]
MAHILVVEDNEIMQKLVAAILEREGHTVTVAPNGKEGLDLLSVPEPPYDLIIADIMMPYANGFEILNKVNKSEGRRIPVIIVSNLSNEQMVLEGFQLGAADYVTKPIMAGELLLRVKRLLNSH